MGTPVLLFLDISSGELLLILIAVFLVFGPSKLPEVARKIGKLYSELKKASDNLSKEFNQETASLKAELEDARQTIARQTDEIKTEIEKTKDNINNEIKNNDINTKFTLDDVYKESDKRTSEQ
ncbi:MAG TPA: twin-arginine translocase TatA/TatE family subunit [Bacteroidales bacterium]|nr:twin-arginine translocase TatA/TatE family subunit [Bacteroidales bacterium]